MLITTEQIIVDIIKNQLNLAANFVFISNQNITIPNDKNLYVTVAMTDGQIISNTKDIVKNGSVDIRSIQQLQISENIQIDILSASNAALLRRSEIVMALSSIYAQQQQEKYQFKIFAVPQSFVNTSIAEGGSQINRFSIVVSCFVWYKKEVDLITGDYYDSFDTRVDDETSIGTSTGLIEFNITGA